MLFYSFVNVPAFFIASVILDLEPLAVLIFDLDYPLHGFMHTYLGSLLVAISLGIILTITFRKAPKIGTFLEKISFFGKNDMKHNVATAISGVWLHIFLDSFLYTDIQPFYPFSINPFYKMLSFTAVYGVCVLAFLVGLPLYGFRWYRSQKENYINKQLKK